MANSNRLIKENSILYKPREWKVCFPGVIEDIAPVRNPARQRWSKVHVHSHGQREMMVALKGNVYHGSAGKVYPCSPGMFFFFDRGSPHDNTYPANTPDFDHLWITFYRGSVFARIIAARKGEWSGRSSIIIETSSAGVPDLSRPFDEVWTGYDEFPTARKRFHIQAALMRIVEELIEADARVSTGTTADDKRRRIIKQICAHLDATGGARANLEDMARSTGYSKFHFHRLFRQYTGVKLHDYINTARKKKAADLEKKGLRKSEISYELGFSCPAAFSRWYKTNMG